MNPFMDSNKLIDKPLKNPLNPYYLYRFKAFDLKFCF